MRMAKRAKALAADTPTPEEGLEDLEGDEQDVPKKPARRGRPPKKITQPQEAESLKAETKKKAARRTKKTSGESPENVDKTKAPGKRSKSPAKKKKAALVYEEIGDSDEDNGEATERFDFDTEEEDARNPAEEEASDQERNAAYFAAAEGSLEMQADDVESSPSNSAPSRSRRGESASPSKRRRRVSSDTDAEDLPDLLQSLRAHEVGLRKSAGTGKHPNRGPAGVLELSDSDSA